VADTPPPRRLSLTKSQLREESGAALLDLLKDITSDGRLDRAETQRLAHWIAANRANEIPAVRHLARTVDRILADGILTADERLELHLGIEKILPVTERSIARVAREKAEQGLSGPRILKKDLAGMKCSELAEVPNPRDWRTGPITERQLDYIEALGGSINPKATKGEASDLIESLLATRPPTNRQQMVMRFWNRSQQAGEGPAEISQWQERFYLEDPDRKSAWELFKEEFCDDGRQGNPSRVPVGVGPQYLARIKRGPRRAPIQAPAGNGRAKSFAIAIVLVAALAGVIAAVFFRPSVAGRDPSAPHVSPTRKQEKITSADAGVKIAVPPQPPGATASNTVAPPLQGTAAVVASLRITGFIGGSRSRVMINGRLFGVGDSIPGAPGLLVHTINVEKKTVSFIDLNGDVRLRKIE
jgi:hypothetical protein